MAELYIDASDLGDKCKRFYHFCSTQNADKMLKCVVRKTGQDTRKILKNDLPDEYYATKRWIGSSTMRQRVVNNAGVQCVIPLKSMKATIGGNHIRASGGVPGWEAVKYKGRGYKIRAHIVKGHVTELPKTMKNQGDNPPFINTAAEKLHGAVFTRKGKDRLPIASVSSLAIPQMPLNLSNRQVTDDILQSLDRRLDECWESHMKL